MIERSDIFINGEWVRSSARDTLPVINPVTEELISTVPRGTAEDADRAVHAAAAAFPQWSQTPLEERIHVIERLAQALNARSAEITRAIVSELGYPLEWASKAQVLAGIEELNIIAESLRQICWEETIGNARVCREPSGVVAAITPWNAPLRTIISKAGAAIAAGCTVALKGSELAPSGSYFFAEMAIQAGVPAGVFNLLSGTGPEVGEAIASHPLVDVVSLTGSPRAGRRVMELASRTVKRVHLELGGKSANIILDEAQLERAVKDGVEDAFRNAGQACGGLTRMLVPKGRLKDAEEIAVAKAKSFRLGDPYDPQTTLGPVITSSARDRIRGVIRSGIEEGARMLMGGPEAPQGLPRGYFIQPTIFTTDNKRRIAREEIFGPVVVIIPFDDEADAIEIANDSPYGLAAGLWCSNPERARAIAKALRVGRVRINGAPLNKRATHGGFKLSGIGREWGRFGVEEFLEYKSILL